MDVGCSEDHVELHEAPGKKLWVSLEAWKDVCAQLGGSAELCSWLCLPCPARHHQGWAAAALSPAAGALCVVGSWSGGQGLCHARTGYRDAIWAAGPPPLHGESYSRHFPCVCGEAISTQGCSHSCVGKNVFPLPRWPVLRVSLCRQACLQAAEHAICGVLCGLCAGTGHSGSGTSSCFLFLSHTVISTAFCHHL